MILKRRFASLLTDLVNFIVFSCRLKHRQPDVNFTQNMLITSHYCHIVVNVVKEHTARDKYCQMRANKLW